ncbi:MAG: ribonuclease P protein subunit [Candidatus Aramenus sp.]|nr:ribonuclease P protein subunit [Candidatus Aramenus sp.]
MHKNLPKNKADFIGFSLKILGNSDSNLIGIRGQVIFETKNTFLVYVGGRVKRIVKANGFYELDFKRSHITICGYKLVDRPAKRVSRG